MLLLPSRITQFHFNGHGRGRHSVKSSLPPELQQLSGLLQLKLSCCAIPPVALRGFPLLQKLHLKRCSLLPLDHPEDPSEFGDADTQGTAALLDALQQLTCLQHLQLNLQDPIGSSRHREPPPHLFAALTASSHLTVLTFEPDCYMPLPKGAVQHMFAARKQLPLLQRLAISNYDHSNGRHKWPHDKWTIDGFRTFTLSRAAARS
jgi:hypothetical protein